MWQQIARNKRNSCILVFLMLLFMLIIGAAFGVCLSYCMSDLADLQTTFYFAQSGIIAAAVVWFVLLVVALFKGKKVILSLNHAYKLPKHAHKVLENVVEEVSIAAGMPKPPEIYVIDTAMPNAFATGLSPKNSAVAVTTGLLTELDRDELQGVIAHEIAHIVNRDSMYMIIAGVMLGTIVYLSDTTVRNFFRSSKARRTGSKGGGAIILVFIFCSILMIISPIIAQILYFSISKRREYLADACAVQFTRYPQGLASALAKIYSSIYVYKDADKITSAMYIVHPLEYEKRYKEEYSMFGSIFSTHPPIEKRIAVLSKMTGADFNAYNAAFSKVSGRRQTILSKQELYGIKPLEIKSSEKEKDFASKYIVNAIAGGTFAQTCKQFEKTSEERKIRKRTAKNIILNANKYIEIHCDCGTTLKFPPEYQGEKIPCPHCGKIMTV